MGLTDRFPTLDPEIAAFLEAMPKRAPCSIEEERQWLEAGVAKSQEATKDQLPSASRYRFNDHIIPVENGEITVRCLIPTVSENEPGGPYPLLVWYHGGGYYLGSINLDDYMLRQICADHKIAIVNVEYRMVPEHPYPTCAHDCYEALKWTVKNKNSLNGSSALGLLVGGASAGGNLAASVALRARDDPFFLDSPVTGQILNVPSLLHPKATVPEKYKAALKSMVENADAPMLNSEELDRCLNILNVPDPDDPIFSIILAPDHKNVAPAYFMIAGLDPLRDEGLLYQKILKEAGVNTKLDFYPEMPHGGHMIYHTAAAKRAHKGFEEGLEWLLSHTKSSA